MRIWVTVHKDGSLSVQDEGRGIPIDKHKSRSLGLELAMTKLRRGKFNEKAYKVSGGLHGVGLQSSTHCPNGQESKSGAKTKSIPKNTK